MLPFRLGRNLRGITLILFGLGRNPRGITLLLFGLGGDLLATG